MEFADRITARSALISPWYGLLLVKRKEDTAQDEDGISGAGPTDSATTQAGFIFHRFIYEVKEEGRTKTSIPSG